MHRSSKIPVIVLIVLFLACSVTQTINVKAQPSDEQSIKDWTIFRHDSEHSGSTVSNAPSNNLTLWKFATSGKVFSSPTVYNNMIYVGSFDGKVYALNALTGKAIWTFQTLAAIYSSPAIFGGVVYVGSLDHNLYALNASTGSQFWNFTTGREVFFISNFHKWNGVLWFGRRTHLCFECSNRQDQMELSNG